MVAHLAELHEHIQQADSIRPSQLVEGVSVFLKDLDVPPLLHFRQSNVQLGFFLGRKRRGHIFLDTTQHEGAQNLERKNKVISFLSFQNDKAFQK